MSAIVNKNSYILESSKGLHSYHLPEIELIGINLKKRLFNIYTKILDGGCDTHEGHPVYFQMHQERLIQLLIKNGNWTIVRFAEKVFACNLTHVNYIAKEVSDRGIEIIFRASVSYSLVSQGVSSEQMDQIFDVIKSDYFKVLRRSDAKNLAQKILPILELEEEGQPLVLGLPHCTAVQFNYQSFQVQIYNNVFCKNRLKISFSTERAMREVTGRLLQLFTPAWEAVERCNAEKKVVRSIYVNSAVPDPQLLKKVIKNLKLDIKA